MKIFLASFLEPENFGYGEIYGICSGEKPKHVQVKYKYTHFIPSEDILREYQQERPNNPKEASEKFISKYKEQLQKFVEGLERFATEQGKTAREILPFQDGDTLCSWERSYFTNYRVILAPFLKELGYEVVVH